MEESSLEYTAENLGIFFQWYFSKDQRMRLGQAACYIFKDLPKKLQDEVFYKEDQKFIGEKLWSSLFDD